MKVVRNIVLGVSLATCPLVSGESLPANGNFDNVFANWSTGASPGYEAFWIPLQRDQGGSPIQGSGAAGLFMAGWIAACVNVTSQPLGSLIINVKKAGALGAKPWLWAASHSYTESACSGQRLDHDDPFVHYFGPVAPNYPSAAVLRGEEFVPKSGALSFSVFVYVDEDYQYDPYRLLAIVDDVYFEETELVFVSTFE